MAYEHKEGFGALFRNKKGADSHPDYRGEFKLNGRMYEIAGWMKTGAKGPYMSLKVQAPRPKRDASEPAPARSGADRSGKGGPMEFDSDIPF